MSISRNYPVKPFSPETHLASGIDAVATTIVLNDATMLPEAPNLAVIEDGDNSEVVLYTTRDANSIGGCTRGFVTDGTRGIARTHAANTPVARYISSYDLNTIMANESYLFSQQAIGVQWDRGADDTTALQLIDVDGNPIETLPFGSFDNHRTYREIRRCILSTTGTPTFGTNARGDGLTLDGSAGRVMVAIPKFWVKADNPSTGVYRWWISPAPLSGFEVHPAFRQRGGKEREYIYVSAYQANLLTRDFPAHKSATLALHSRTGEQPVTGSGALVTLPFTSGGTTAPTIGETMTGASTGETGIVVDWNVTSGTWAGGDAAGTIILRQVGTSLESENLNGSIAGANCLTVGAQTPILLPMTEARTYAENVGSGWGLINIWTWSAIVLLQMVEHQTMNMQAVLGRGVSDLPTGDAVFGGRINGYGSADATIGTNGTGMALGTNGQTPIVWRGIENLWGNIQTFVDGATADASDHRVKVIPRGGTTLPMATGSAREISIGPLASVSMIGGYINDLLWEPLTRLLFLPSTATGSVGTFTCDYYLDPGAEGCILCNGGFGWFTGSFNGPFAIDFSKGPADGANVLGARLEYIGPEGASPTTVSVTPGGGGDPITIPAPVTVTTPTTGTPIVATDTPVPIPQYPTAPSTDPPIWAVPKQTVVPESGEFTFTYQGILAYNKDEPHDIEFDAGAMNSTRTTYLMTGQKSAQKYGKTPTYLAGFQLEVYDQNYVPGTISPRLPAGATIKGIRVGVYGNTSAVSPSYARITKMFLRFYDANGQYVDSNDKANPDDHWQYVPEGVPYDPYNWESAHKPYLKTFGGDDDLWGLTTAVVTPTKLNNWGVAVGFQMEIVGNPGPNGVIRLYAITLEITYEV